MKIIFTIKYHTEWGERLFVAVTKDRTLKSSLDYKKQDAADTIRNKGLGMLNNSQVIEMYYVNEDKWRLEVTIPNSVKELKYHYLVENESGVRNAEDGGFERLIAFDLQCDTYFLYDDWITKPTEQPFYSSAFTKNLFSRVHLKLSKIYPFRDVILVENHAPDITFDQIREPKHAEENIIIRVRAPETKPDEVVALAGNQPCLGAWHPKDALQLSDNDFPLWEIRLNAGNITFPLEYKFVVLEKATKSVRYWEEGKNRAFSSLQQSEGGSNNVSVSCAEQSFNSNNRHIIDNYRLRTPNLSWKACGTVVPLFSLRSERSFGIGDIGDLQTMIDWAVITKQHVIQLLPVQDTTRTHTWKDSYPYSAISNDAIHPLYVNIQWMGELKDVRKRNCYQKLQRQLNEKETVDYEMVEKYKTAWYRDYFNQEKDNILKDKDFLHFITHNKEWLIPYAAFSYLRDKYHTADFTQWGTYACYNQEQAELLCLSESESYHECTFLFFIQFTLNKQMEVISRYARNNRIILKGDLPIGINRESVEAWTEPGYFNREVQAGAPPDHFSEKGQNWSFPTYNWETMKQDGYTWWKKRFHRLEQFFDSFRIDHILGFFRIWEIPHDYVEGLCGYFNPALPLQKAEIEQYGMRFDNRWLTPHIHKKYLRELFGDDSEHVISTYLHAYDVDSDCINIYPRDAERLVLNDFCSTQRKIVQLFCESEGENQRFIKDGLMRIANEILFISDPYHPDCFHPRIASDQSYIYQELSDNNRNAFNKLYMDYFYNRHNEFWKITAMSRLQPLLKCTNMLVCGEDLGMIPATVHEVMDDLQILSLELGHMPKVEADEFSDLTKIPYHAVYTTSTHDMNPLRAWWTEDKEKTQRYYNNMLHREGIAPEACTAEIAEQIIFNHLRASSMLTMIPLQDWFAMDDTIKRPDANDERINDPTNPNHYWRYRMHITLETLLQSTMFNEKIQKNIAESGR